MTGPFPLQGTDNPCDVDVKLLSCKVIGLVKHTDLRNYYNENSYKLIVPGCLSRKILGYIKTILQFILNYVM